MPGKHCQSNFGLRTKEPFQRTSPGKSMRNARPSQLCWCCFRMWWTEPMEERRGDEAKSVWCLNFLTWNYRDSFQSSENPECSQRWDIAQVHKLCHISVVREVTHRQKWQTRTQTQTPKEKKRNHNKTKSTIRHVRALTQHLTPTPGHLTWDYRNSFQSPQNPESA